MKKEQPQPTDLPPPPEKSFSVAFGQVAQLLRKEVKMKDRATKVLTTSPLPASFNNALRQIAKILRDKVHSVTPSKKRKFSKGRTAGPSDIKN